MRLSEEQAVAIYERVVDDKTASRFLPMLVLQMEAGKLSVDETLLHLLALTMLKEIPRA